MLYDAPGVAYDTPGITYDGGSAVAPPAPRTLQLLWSATPPVLLWSGVAAALQWSAVGPQLTWSVNMAQRQNVTVYSGEDSLWTLTQTVSSADIAGWTFRLRIWPWSANFAGTPVVDSKNTASIVFTVTNATAGVFTVLLPDAVTALLAAGYYGYEVRRVDSGYNTMLAWGQLTVGEFATQQGA